MISRSSAALGPVGGGPSTRAACVSSASEGPRSPTRSAGTACARAGCAWNRASVAESIGPHVRDGGAPEEAASMEIDPSRSSARRGGTRGMTLRRPLGPGPMHVRRADPRTARRARARCPCRARGTRTWVPVETARRSPREVRRGPRLRRRRPRSGPHPPPTAPEPDPAIGPGVSYRVHREILDDPLDLRGVDGETTGSA